MTKGTRNEIIADIMDWSATWGSPLSREQAEAKAEKDKAANDAQCKQLLSGLNTMRSVGRIASVNDKGEREYMTDEQRDALIASREQEYNQHCN